MSGYDSKRVPCDDCGREFLLSRMEWDDGAVRCEACASERWWRIEEARLEFSATDLDEEEEG